MIDFMMAAVSTQHPLPSFGLPTDEVGPGQGVLGIELQRRESQEPWPDVPRDVQRDDEAQALLQGHAGRDLDGARQSDLLAEGFGNAQAAAQGRLVSFLGTLHVPIMYQSSATSPITSAILTNHIQPRTFPSDSTRFYDSKGTFINTIQYSSE